MWRHLRRSGRGSEKRFPSEDRRKDPKGPCQKAPRSANNRRNVGHWERGFDGFSRTTKSAVWW
ncbi:MAG: hypothetical protein H6625_01510 [Bdellovibrionaceae bacterium]|nr:hypothetical protein [Pseudobdellovibrionaceae bacterium]